MRHGKLNLEAYEVKKRLGRGGYGKVYLAQDRKLNRDYAIKVLRAPLIPDQSTLERFKHEVEIRGLTGLAHPNIVEVYRIEDDPLPPVIVMELVDGTHLGTYLKPSGMPLEMVLPILRQIASALDAAHQQGVIHGNLKPSNVLLNQQGEVKLTDFGLVQALQSAGGDESDAHFGTVLYMAPEQALGLKEITPATDIYALAVMTYQLLIGQAPFVGSSHAVLAAHRDVPPPQPSTFGVNLPDGVVSPLMFALSKEPSERYTTATDFVTALEEGTQSQGYGAAAQMPIDMPPLPLVEQSPAPSTNVVVMPQNVPSDLSSAAPFEEQAVSDKSRLLAASEEEAGAMVVAGEVAQAAAKRADRATTVSKQPVKTPQRPANRAKGRAGAGAKGARAGTTAERSRKSSKSKAAEEAKEEEKRGFPLALVALALLLLLCLVGAAGWWFFGRGTGEPAPVVVLTPNFSLREGPGDDYAVIGTYNQDAALTLVGREENETWLEVETADGQRGWLFSELVQVNIPLSEVALAETATPTPTETLVPTETLIATETPLPTETAEATSEPRPTRRPTRESARATRTPRGGATDVISDTAVISDTGVLTNTIEIAEGITLTNTTEITESISLTDTTEITESISLTDTAVLSETAALSPTATFIPTQRAVAPTPWPIQPTATYIPPTPWPIPPTATYIPPTATYIPPTATYIPPTATYIPPTATYIPPTATNIPPTATNIPPTATNIPPTATNIPPTATNIPPTATNIPPTATYIPPTATYSPTATPWPTPASLPTWTSFPTTTPATPAPAFPYRISLITSDYSRGCEGGFYIFGYVRDSAGNPLSGELVQATSEYGHQIPASVSKADPPGWYDIIISAQRSHWFVEMIDGSGNSLSPTAEILNTGRFVDGSEACWHQVDFIKN